MEVPDMKKETIDWAVALNDHMAKRTSPPPAGWLTTRQIAKLWCLTTTTASRNLGQMCKNGTAEMRKFSSEIKVQTSLTNRLGPHRSYCRRTPYFRLIKKR
jgi:hypothetical protein